MAKENMLIKSLVLILVNDSISGNKNGRKALANNAKTRKESATRKIQCEQIIQTIRLMKFRFIFYDLRFTPEQQ